jgi:hypothetical protein
MDITVPELQKSLKLLFSNGVRELLHKYFVTGLGSLPRACQPKVNTKAEPVGHLVATPRTHPDREVTRPSK